MAAATVIEKNLLLGLKRLPDGVAFADGYICC